MAYNTISFLAGATTGYVIPLNGNFATVKVTTDQTILAYVAGPGVAPTAPLAQPTLSTPGTSINYVGITSAAPFQFGDFAVSPGQPYDLFSYLVVWCKGTNADLTIVCH